jgi:hypothetical protein
MNSERLRLLSVTVYNSKSTKLFNSIFEKSHIPLSEAKILLLRILHYMSTVEPERYGDRVLRLMKATPKLIMLVQFLAMLTVASAIGGLHHYSSKYR